MTNVVQRHYEVHVKAGGICYGYVGIMLSRAIAGRHSNQRGGSVLLGFPTHQQLSLFSRHATWRLGDNPTDNGEPHRFLLFVVGTITLMSI